MENTTTEPTSQPTSQPTCGKCHNTADLWKANELGKVSFESIKHLIEPYENGLCESCLLGMIPKLHEE